jgi:membrane fusion protein (multidrug efflux system)
VEPGSFVSTGQPLMAIVPDECWVVANFKEVQLEHMRPGQPAEVRVDAFSDLRLRARVDSIQKGTGSRFQLLPPENATGNWVKVVQRVPVKLILEPGQQDARLLALGMSVEVTVDETNAPIAPQISAHAQLLRSPGQQP